MDRGEDLADEVGGWKNGERVILAEVLHHLEGEDGEDEQQIGDKDVLHEGVRLDALRAAKDDEQRQVEVEGQRDDQQEETEVVEGRRGHKRAVPQNVRHRPRIGPFFAAALVQEGRKEVMLVMGVI